MILHFCTLEKFIPSFIELINDEFDSESHRFLVFGDRKKFPFKEAPNVEYYPSFIKFGGSLWASITTAYRFIKLCNQSKKVILHGLWDDHLIELLFFFPQILKKCYWAVWGGDLYRYKFRANKIRLIVHEFFRRVVIKRLENIIAFIPGDFELAQKWYLTRARLHRCFMYTSNIFVPPETINCDNEFNRVVKILIGNSADPRNNHIEAFEKIRGLKDSAIQILVPLSYGDRGYAKDIIKIGKEIFGEKFVPIENFMDLREYLAFLSQVDIAVFNHDRQQAMGNIIALLGSGKRVFLRKEVVTYEFFRNLGVKIFDVQEFCLNCLKISMKDNIKVIQENFSRDRLINDLNEIFEG